MTIGIAVVGPGLIGKKHISLIRANRDTHLAAIVAPDHAWNHHIAAKEDVPLFFDLAICTSAVKVDAVIISSPNPYHFEQARWCVEKNLPVLIEKPITPGLKEARKLVQLVSERGAKALVGHHRVYSPLLDAAQSVIREGQLGRLVSVIGSAQFFKPSQYFLDGPWRAQPGGGPLLINMIHEVGNLRALMGEIVSVQAMSSSAIRNFAVEDTVVINFCFENGALGTFILSDTAATPMSWEQTSRENPSYSTYSNVDCYTITGTQGSLSFPTMQLRFFPADQEASWWKPFSEIIVTVERDDPLGRQLAHFVDVIRDNVPPKVPVSDGYRNLLVTVAIHEAVQSGSTVQIRN